MKRGGPTGELKKEYDDFETKFGPLIKHYRLQGNFLEVSLTPGWSSLRSARVLTTSCDRSRDSGLRMSSGSRCMPSWRVR